MHIYCIFTYLFIEQLLLFAYLPITLRAFSAVSLSSTATIRYLLISGSYMKYFPVYKNINCKHVLETSISLPYRMNQIYEVTGVANNDSQQG